MFSVTIGHTRHHIGVRPGEAGRRAFVREVRRLLGVDDSVPLVLDFHVDLGYDDGTGRDAVVRSRSDSSPVGLGMSAPAPAHSHSHSHSHSHLHPLHPYPHPHVVDGADDGADADAEGERVEAVDDGDNDGNDGNDGDDDGNDPLARWMDAVSCAMQRPKQIIHPQFVRRLEEEEGPGG